jgi:alkylhydroperoxidase family enzyme
MLSYAEKIALNAASVTEADIAGFRAAGFDDAEIFDIALCASIRCFVSRFYDAVGAAPDAAFREMAPDFRDPLVVGKPLDRALSG